MNKKYLPLVALSILFMSIISAFSSNTGTGVYRRSTPTDTTGPLAILAKDHKGKSVTATNGAVSFTAGLQNDYYLTGSPDKTVSFYLEAKIARFLNDQVKRVPLNISVVIDRSGSMEGIKMGYAKKAARAIVDQLKPEDLISIVMYDHAVDSVQSPVHVIDKEKIKAKIDRITPRGSTNLWGGTEQGYQYVEKNYKAGFINRVLLISDGLANVGLTDSALIRIRVQKFKDDEGISLSTFGVGLDYNETLMTDMAETGAGNYYFIEAPDQMAGLFNKELSGLMNVAAQNAELRVRLPKGVRVQKGYPLKFQQTDNEVVIKLRDLSSEEIRGSLFTLRLDDTTRSVLKFLSALTYTDVSDGLQKTIVNENTLIPVKSSEAYLTHFNRQVIEQTVLYTANEKLETAMDLMEKGAYAEAGKYISENKDYLKANAIYVKGNGSLMKMDSVNSNYSGRYMEAKSISLDSAKRIQKANKAVNYQLRNKKQ
jgi:Ca-activated chloride channel family protein